MDRTVSSSLRVQMGVEHPVAHARWPMAGIARCKSATAGPAFAAALELDRCGSAFLCGAAFCPLLASRRRAFERFVSFSELLPVSNSSMRWVQKDHEMARTMTV